MSGTFCTHKVPAPPEGFKWSDEPPSCPYCHIAELKVMLANRQEMALADSTRIAELEQENHRYREALEAIIKHYKVIAPTAMEYSATYHIAKKALEAEDEL